MLVTGAGRLESVCPKCHNDLPKRFGRAGEIVMPMFGASNAGKTRLMYMLATVLMDWVYDQGGSVRYIGDASERLATIKDSLRARSHTEKTVATTPRGLALDVQIGLIHKLVYFFDSAGELFLREDGLAEMRFLNKAKTYIHVADPLSSRGLWSQLSPGDQARLERFQSSPGTVAEVYQRTANQMLRMTPQKAPSKLAFVVSKVDLVKSAGLHIGDTSDEIKEWVSDGSGLDMEDVAREASQRFAEVEYYGTAALEEEGRIDDSVEEVLRWILANEGIDMGNRGT
jgi:hypothetical protein